MKVAVRKKGVLILIIISLFFLCIELLCAETPPMPHGIAGYIHDSDKVTQAKLGTWFKINDTTSGFFLKSKTSVPVPGMTGRYSVVVNGSDGDSINITAWNNTHYGKTWIMLEGDMGGINLSLNITRASEPNVTITYPVDSALFNVSENFTVNVTVGIIGGANGTECYATISFSSQNIISLKEGENYTHFLGNISSGYSNKTFWNVYGNRTGFVNITAAANCTSDMDNMEGLNWDIVYNIGIRDLSPPIVSLVAPENNTLNTTENSIFFYYNVTDDSDIANCSLIINNNIIIVNTTAVVKDTTQSILATLSNGQYNWTVNCTDVVGNSGGAGYFYNISVNSAGATVQNIVVTNPINLEAGTTVTIACNATILSPGGISGIRTNATLFDILVSSPDSEQDNNNNYKNSSCLNLSSDSTSMNITCTFKLWYYSNNGTWQCNITASDSGGLELNSSSINTTINLLYAIGTNTTTVDYGSILPGNYSSDDENLTIYNYGNADINVSIEGYGRNQSDNLSMICNDGTNISIDYERYSVVSGREYSLMINLTSGPVPVENLTLPRRTLDSGFGNDKNYTFLKMGVPELRKETICNGTIILYATVG